MVFIPGPKKLLMDPGQTGPLGAAASPVVGMSGTELVTIQLPCLEERIVLEKLERKVQACVMEETAVQVGL